jgi:hypothetical protein
MAAAKTGFFWRVTSVVFAVHWNRFVLLATLADGDKCVCTCIWLCLTSVDQRPT